MIEFTKEQEEQLKKGLEKVKYETIYICKKCNERLKGMINVGKHKEENWDHFEYLNPDSGLCVGFL